MARTQKNKATAKHLGLLKAKLSKLKRELVEPRVSSAVAAALPRMCTRPRERTELHFGRVAAAAALGRVLT